MCEWLNKPNLLVGSSKHVSSAGTNIRLSMWINVLLCLKREGSLYTIDDNSKDVDDAGNLLFAYQRWNDVKFLVNSERMLWKQNC